MEEFQQGGIKNVAFDRVEFGVQAVRLIRLAPVAGWGPGGFYRNLSTIRFLYQENDRNRFHGFSFVDNANNHYLQQASELGLLGAGMNLLLHLLPLWMIIRVRKQIAGMRERLVTGIAFSCVCIMLLLYLTAPYLFHTDVRWIFSVYIAFLYVSAVQNGYPLKRYHSRIFTTVFIVLTLVFIMGTYHCTFGDKGYKELLQTGWSSMKPVSSSR